MSLYSDNMSPWYYFMPWKHFWYLYRRERINSEVLYNGNLECNHQVIGCTEELHKTWVFFSSQLVQKIIKEIQYFFCIVIVYLTTNNNKNNTRPYSFPGWLYHNIYKTLVNSLIIYIKTMDTQICTRNTYSIVKT